MSICENVNRGSGTSETNLEEEAVWYCLMEENADLMRTSPLQPFMWTQTRQSCYNRQLPKSRGFINCILWWICASYSTVAARELPVKPRKGETKFTPQEKIEATYQDALLREWTIKAMWLRRVLCQGTEWNLKGSDKCLCSPSHLQDQGSRAASSRAICTTVLQLFSWAGARRSPYRRLWFRIRSIDRNDFSWSFFTGNMKRGGGYPYP